MVFSSLLFLFVFLPIFLVIYFVLPRKIRNVWLLLASLFFYSWGEGRLVAVLLFSTFADYCIGLFIANNGFCSIWRQINGPIQKGALRSRSQKIALTASIIINLSVLAIFKYADFGLENYAVIADMFGWSRDVPLSLGIALPLGVSFYTFQSMSYTIDVYRGSVKATRNLLAFATYVTMFPQLVAGPIVRYVDVAKELVNRTVSRAKFAYGIRRFVIGLAKKVLIANVISGPVDQIFALPADTLSAPVAWLGVIGYALQIYFDFSGYSDMAIGLGRMFGFTFLENFRFPYIARSMRGFWQRWHISLSTWFRDYVYIPLGGNRKGHARTYMNLLIVFLVTGFWHGASWSFIVWGLFHGIFLSLERIQGGAWLKKIPKVLQHMYVLGVVLISWVFFRTDSLVEAVSYIGSLFGAGSGASTSIFVYMTNVVITAVVIGIIGSTPIASYLKRFGYHLVSMGTFKKEGQLQYGVFAFGEITIIVTLFLLTILQLANGTHNPFIYFRF